jgi:uncharacterized phosphatase
MTTICLVRHGETDWNALGKLQGGTDIPLNSRGIQQAEECREFFKDSHFDVLIASPLKRAKRTAEIINRDLNLPIVEMKDFVEKHFGDAEGMSMKERTAIFPNKEYPNEENWMSFQERVMEGVHKVNQMFPDQKVLLVAHGGVINAILATISNGEIGAGKTRLINACISNIHFQEEKWNVKEYNQVSHLTDYMVKGKI